MTLENSIKDVIAKKLEDGTVEKLVAEQIEIGVNKALSNLFGSYGDITKVIENQIKGVMLPYIESYDYSKYLVKLDSVMVEVLKKSASDNSKILLNFKELMLPEDRETIKASELFELWCKYVAKNVETDGLDIDYDDGVSYVPVEVAMEVESDESRSWRCFNHATIILECEHDEEMNFAIRLSQYTGYNNEKAWDIHYDTVKDLSSLRRLNDFQILLMRLDQAGTKLIMDIDSICDEIRPDKQPEASFS